ncbi:MULTISPECIES: HlyD family type I secretion periplasmic adaptor subunit [Mameliella]|uniref:Membrane fusion protein (MFP) family protein n=1 Tax=Mameliella alba TaxID=561184 RepID=A0A0B3S168_9RHOB|nr:MULTISPECIES: HlyD family type I secretion periplasmic adaptor subunit [Mameliella]MCR9273964.1 HlyD family type I secretion periplasmic adaptor subunit [Paracoccaceae bacterium]ODM50261.1 RTX toxin [Ruegeria sp. PBVC088]KHQ52708.1 RTX toxin [Mameliella alba]MDD9728894.1 HlyD family type I secretion periplasmic adaptor subunit [Mameliella sp. AT18]OWV47229.1 HlyD family type I secretion periplasmic adaptor subunit [Mameliella alba]
MSPEKQFSLRMPMIFGIIGLTILVGGFGTWAATTNISGAIVASGQIEVDQNRQVVQHPDGGVVAKILVDEGDTVTEGQVLIRLDPTLLLSELNIIEGQLYEIMSRRARLQAERDAKDEIVFAEEVLNRAVTDPEVAELVEGQRNLFFARRDSVEGEIGQLRKRSDQIADQVIGILAQQEALARQLELIKEELVNKEELRAQGLVRAPEILALQREEARLAGSVGELKASKAQAEGRITEIDIQILSLQTKRREEAITTLRDLQFRERELAEKRLAIRERLNRLDITAPVGGVIYGLTIFTPRSVIRPADPVLFIVPQDRPLVIAAQVEPIHIDKLFVDQEVSLRFSSLDQRQTPELFGRVVQISADAFEDQNSRVRYYRAEIVLNEGEIDRLPEGAALIPGMPVEAFIRTEDRTPLAYLVKPFTDYFAKAFRES